MMKQPADGTISPKRLPRRSRMQSRFVAASHYTNLVLGRRFPNAIPMVSVTGYPKSGTTWCAQLIADYLQWPFPRLSLFPLACQSVIHGHDLPGPKLPNPVYVMRDGRDVFVSLYFHILRGCPPGDTSRWPKRLRRMFPGMTDPEDTRANLGPFIAAQVKSPFGAREHWGAHVSAYLKLAKHTPTPVMRYEALHADAEGVLGEVLERLTGEPACPERVAATVQKYSFAQQTGRKPGETVAADFMRKGEVGDWKNHFSPQAAEVFITSCGEALVAAGYEPGHAWARDLPDVYAPVGGAES